MINCPCGYGKNLNEEYKICPVCGTDLSPLHRIKAVPKYYYERGQNLTRQAKYDEAIDSFITAINLDPKFINPYISLIKIYIGKKLYNEAHKLLEKLKEIFSDDEVTKLEIRKLEAKIKREKEKLSRKKLLISGFQVGIISILAICFVIILFTYWVKENKTNINLSEEIKREISNIPELANLNLKVNTKKDQIEVYGIVPASLHKILLKEIIQRIGKNKKVNTTGVNIAHLPKTFIYKVKEGENLSVIAFKFYGNRDLWKMIYEVNKDKVSNPQKIFPGQKILIPIDIDICADIAIRTSEERTK